MFSAISRAFSAPLNLSGAIKIRTARISYTVCRVSSRAKRSGVEGFRGVNPSVRSRASSTAFGMTALWLCFQFPLQDFAHNFRVRLSFRQLDHLSLEKIQRCSIACSKIRYWLWIRRDHFVTQRFNGGYVAELLHAFFFHNQG